MEAGGLGGVSGKHPGTGGWAVEEGRESAEGWGLAAAEPPSAGEEAASSQEERAKSQREPSPPPEGRTPVAQEKA